MGTPPYQHPQRSASSRLSLRLDDFSTLLIYDVLRALAAEPSLWAKYVAQTNNDKLLFREDDFRFPEKSTLRHDLLFSADPRVREITECLFAAAAGRIDSVPCLHEVIKPREAPDRSTSQPISNQHNLPVPQSGKLHAENLRKPQSRPSGRGSLPKLRGYELIAEVGKGALGTVFLARSETDGREVAVKFMPIPTTAKPTLRRRFLAETDRVSQVRHPNMPGMIEKGTVGQAFYFVTEYCDLGILREWMQSSGGKLRAELRPVMQRRLDALKHSHLHRLLHGHISPQNILFARAGNQRTVKISDFALAAKFERGFSSPPSKSVDLRRACFVPPERFTSDYGLDSRSDLWGLAAVFYHAISGAFPWDFHGRDPLDVIPREDPIPLKERVVAVAASVAEVIDRALRPKPAMRYSSAAEMKSAWDAAFTAVF